MGQSTYRWIFVYGDQPNIIVETTYDRLWYEAPEEVPDGIVKGDMC